MSLFHLVWHQWRHHGTRTLFSVLSISVAVAAVLSTTLAQSSVRGSYQRLLSAVDQRPTLEVIASDGGSFATEDLPLFDSVSGVESVFPSLTRPTLARVQGRRFRAMLLGLPESSSDVWKMLRLVDGTYPNESNQGVVGEELARSLQIATGDRVIVITRRGPRSVIVSGIATSASFREFAPGSSLAVSLSLLQSWFASEDRVNRVRLVLDSSQNREAVRAAIALLLPKTLTIQAARDYTELADNILRATELAVRFAGALSVVLATFIIVNTLRMNFGQRRKDLAIVRVLGATTRQIIGLHLMEGGCLGLLSVVGGIPAGVLMGQALSQAMQQLLEVELPPPEISWWWVFALAPLGPLIGCLGAVVPAIASRSVGPNEAMGETEFRRAERFPYWSIIAGSAAWCGAFLLLFLVIFERIAPEYAVPAGLLMLTAFVVIIPALLRPLLRGFGLLVTPLGGIESHLAVEHLLRRPTRTGLTVGACVVAVSSGLGLGSAIGNHVEAIYQWQRRTMAGDIVVMDPSAAEEVGAAVERQSLRQTLQQLPHVRRIDEHRYLSSRVNGNLALCAVRDFPPDEPLPWNIPSHRLPSVRQAFASGELILSSLLAHAIDVQEGDSVQLQLRGEMLTTRVAAIVEDFHLGGMVSFLNATWAANRLDLGPPDGYVIHLEDVVKADYLLAQLRAVATSEGVVVESFSELRRQQSLVITGITGGLWTLFAVGFVVSGIGVANTLTMNILEQRRELGLLRILGMTRGQAGKLVCGEALVIGLSGSLLGVAAGVTTAWVIHLCNEPLLGRSIPFSVPILLLLSNIVGCWIIALLAAVTPGRIVLRLNLLEAIADE
jgi:putative ABC transport system permease protein